MNVIRIWKVTKPNVFPTIIDDDNDDDDNNNNNNNVLFPGHSSTSPGDC